MKKRLLPKISLFKKQYFFLIIITLLSLTHKTSFTQEVKLKTGLITLSQTTDQFIKESVQSSSVINGRYYRLMCFKQIPIQKKKEELESFGLRFDSYLPNKCYIVSIPFSFDKQILSNYAVSHVQKIPLLVKHDPAIFESPLPIWADDNNNVKIAVTLMKDGDINYVTNFIKNNAGQIIEINNPVKIIRCSYPKKLLNNLIEVPIVNFVSLISPPGEPEDNKGRVLHRSNAINTSFFGGRNYTGDSVSIGVNDDGFVGPHIDFKGRTEQSSVQNDFTGDHGDMVAGILAGAGNLNPAYAGMAKGAKLHVRQYNSSLPQSVQLHNDSGVMVFSSSYGNGCNGGYTSLCRQVDQEIRLNPSLIQVFSCGNSGNSDCGYGAGAGWGNITGGHKQGKNVIATANLYYNGSLVSSSSRGPATDGRIKPDLAAHGQGQISTDPNNIYSPGGGTSAAAPGISGVLAQLYQAYRKLNNGTNPESSLLKACMLNTAEDYGNTGPDFSFGWGRVNALKAVKVLEENRYLDATISQGATNTHTINIPQGVVKAKIMVYWLDFEAMPSSSQSLVNDIDLTVSYGTNTFYPWVLNSTPTSAALSSPATTGIDHLNNMEQVTLFNPNSGDYNINIDGFNIPQGPQKYYLIYEFITDEITVTYPIGGEGFSPGTVELVQWDAEGNNGMFSFEYTTDDGLNWNSFGLASGSTRMKNWYVPNNVTGKAKIRVSRDEVIGESQHTFSIIETPNNIQVDSICYCYVGISWDPVPNAAGYEISVLGDKYMDSIGTSNTNHYKIPVENQNDEFWYSVRSLTTDGTKGERAVAQFYAGNNNVNCSLNSNFTSNNNSLCVEVPLELYDLSIGCPTSWQWSFSPNNITFLEGTNQNSVNPIVSFQEPGIYSISLTTSNSLMTDAITKNDIINVISSENIEVIEDFESTDFPPNNWIIENPDNGSTWLTTNVTGSDGEPSNVTFINNSLDTNNSNDRLVSFPVVLNENLTNPYLTFDVSYSYLENNLDELIVEISDDCGETFLDTIYYKYGLNLATTDKNISSWTPSTASQWRKEYVSLHPLIGQTISFSFNNKSNNGNSLYLDNINIKNISSEEYNPLNFNLYPNPNYGNFSVEMENFEIEEINLKIIDTRGKLIVFNKYSFNDNSSRIINFSKSLAAGYYYIELSNSEKTIIQPFVVINE